MGELSLADPSYSTLRDLPGRTDDDGEWQPALQIAQRLAQFGSTQPSQADQIADRRAGQEGPYRAGLIDCQSNHLPSFRRIFAKESIKNWHFLDARGAPGGPEIQQQWLASQSPHLQLGA